MGVDGNISRTPPLVGRVHPEGETVRSAYRLVAPLCAVAVAAVGVTACGSSESSSSDSDGKFTVALPADPGNLNPYSGAGLTRFVGRFAYDSLVNLRSDGEIVSGLAQRWDVRGATVRYTLADGATCADGSRLRASDVAAAYRYILDPSSKSQLLGLVVPPGLRVQADDAAGTLTMRLPAPDPFVLRKATQVLVVCRRALANPDSLQRGMSGTGPYRLVETVAGDHFTFERRDGYAWGPAGATSAELPRTVVLRVVRDQTTAANLIVSGALNAAQIAGADRDRVEGQGLFKVDVRGPAGQLYFNQDAARPGSDERVRRALTAALRLPEIGRVLTAGTGLPTRGLLTTDPTPCPGDPVAGSVPAYDADESAALLDEAGWRAGSNGVRSKDGKPLKLTFIFTPAEFGAAVASAAELAAEQWRSLGVETELKQVTDSQLNDVVLGSGDWDAGFVPIGWSLPDQLVPFFAGPTPPDGLNFAHVDNADYRRAVAAASRATGADGCRLWLDSERALFERVDAVPFTDGSTPVFGKGAEFAYSNSDMVPTSIRLTAR